MEDVLEISTIIIRNNLTKRIAFFAGIYPVGQMSIWELRSMSKLI